MAIDDQNLRKQNKIKTWIPHLLFFCTLEDYTSKIALWIIFPGKETVSFFTCNISYKTSKEGFISGMEEFLGHCSMPINNATSRVPYSLTFRLFSVSLGIFFLFLYLLLKIFSRVLSVALSQSVHKFKIPYDFSMLLAPIS